MNLEIQWFIAALVEAELVEKEDAVVFFNSFPEEPELEDYAQGVLDQVVAGMSEAEAQAMLEQIQTEIDIAREQAEYGEAPALFAGPRVARKRNASGADAPPPAPVAESAAPESAVAPEPAAPEPPMERKPTPPPKAKAEPGADPEAELATWFDSVRLLELSAEEVRDLLIRLFAALRRAGVSDLHLSAGARPFIRRARKLERLGSEPLAPEESERLNFALLTPAQRERFLEEQDLSFALEFEGERYRGALMRHKRGVSGSYRLVPSTIPSLEELGFLPEDAVTVRRLLDFQNGLILVTGPLGCGKTTTLAVLLDQLNRERYDHVLTVEDPIEILQTSRNCLINQREIGSHTESCVQALRAALREDPDIIVIGEMHGSETIENAVSASETGHLVLGTLHTGDAGNTLSRVLEVFPQQQQPQIRAMTAGSLRGIICQKLVPATNGRLTVIYEILVNSTAVSNLITEGKIYQLPAAMQIGGRLGMCTFDQCVLKKYRQKLISYEVAEANLTDAASRGQLRQERATREARRLAAEQTEVSK